MSKTEVICNECHTANTGKKGRVMLEINVDREENLVTVKPTGRLAKEDFERLSEAVDGYINVNDLVPNLMIVAESFPYWESFTAFFAHARFIRMHHKIVKKIAIVGDSFVLSNLPAIADHFVSAEVRHFAHNDLEKARKWARCIDSQDNKPT